MMAVHRLLLKLFFSTCMLVANGQVKKSQDSENQIHPFIVNPHQAYHDAFRDQRQIKHLISSSKPEIKGYLSDSMDEISSTLKAYSYLESIQLFEEVLEHAFENLETNDTKCAISTTHFIEDLTNKENYTSQVLDALGKLPAGVLQGNTKWLGNYDQCIEITKSNKTSGEIRFQGKYCGISIQIQGTPFVGQNGVYLGVCLPDTCGSEDASNILNMVFEKIGLSNRTRAFPGTCAEKKEWSPGDITAWVLIGIFILLSLVGTLYDGYVQMRYADTSDRSQSHAHGDDLVRNDVLDQEHQDNVLPRHQHNGQELTSNVSFSSKPSGKMHQALIAFSWTNNGSKILNTKTRAGTLECVNGIRVISMLWVMLGHTFSFYMGILGNALEASKLVKDFAFQAILNATVSVDSFFFLSGLLVAYLILKKLRSDNGHLNWGVFYLHRYWRLTPVYMMVLMFYCTLYLHIPEGPFMRSADNTIGVTNCYSYWWTNLLYINNFVPHSLGEECMGWSWYLANDMQFFLISPPLLILLFRKPKIGVCVVSIIMLASITAIGVFSRIKELGAGTLGGITDQNAWSDLYVQAYFRIPPYLVGMLLGHVLSSRPSKIRLHRIFVVLGWAIAFAMNLSVVYGLYGSNHSENPLDLNTAAFFNAMSRTAWAIGLAWVVFACINGYGGMINAFLSLPIWVPLGRLTYCAYLVHPMIISLWGFCMRAPLIYTPLNMAWLYVGNVTLSYMVAFAVSLLFEAPAMGLEKIVLKK